MWDPGPIIAKILHDKCPCILVLPRWHKYWKALLVGSHVRDRYEITYFPGLYTPSALVPTSLRNVRFSLMAYRIDFTGL